MKLSLPALSTVNSLDEPGPLPCARILEPSRTGGSSKKMFKKGCAINQKSLLSGADRKKLRRRLEAAFHLTEGAVEQVLPSKTGDVEVLKAPAPSRTVIYLHDKVPILVDCSGKDDLFPTVFALWRSPHMLPRVYVKHPFVTTYLVNGADLMLPGADMTPGADDLQFQKGDCVAVCVRGNPAPLAVGVAGMSSADAFTKAAQGLKGKLVEVLQVYADFLWSELGGKQVPNAGYLSNAVVPLGAGAEALSAQYGGEDSGPDEPDAAPGASPAADPARDAAEPSAAAAAAGVASLAVGGANPAAAAQVDRPPAPPAAACAAAAVPESMDELLELTLLQALSRVVKDGDLPMAGSSFWAQHMLNCRPAGVTLDVKKSKHKKFSKFLSAYGGRGGLLTLKEDKHSGDVMITAVNRGHALLTEFRPRPLYATAGGASDGAAEGDCGAGAAPAAAPGPAGGAAAELVIEELWKAGRELKGVLKALDVGPDTLFSEKEVGELAFKYVAHASLESASDPTEIVLDATLCDALFKGLVKAGETFPTHLPKAELRECFLRRCQLHCCMSRGGVQLVKKGSRPALVVSAKKKQGHRITLIVGMESFIVDPHVVASDCQKRFACSTAANELPGRDQGHEVIIQGHAEGVADFLAQSYGIPKKYIRVD